MKPVPKLRPSVERRQSVTGGGVGTRVTQDDLRNLRARVDNAHVDMSRRLADGGTVDGDNFSGARLVDLQEGRVDLLRYPATADVSVGLDPLSCLRLGYVGWRRVGQTALIAVAEQGRLDEIRASIPKSFGKYAFVHADAQQIESTVVNTMSDALRIATRDRCPENMSCRSWAGGNSRFLLPLILISLIALVVTAPYVVLSALLVWVTLANFSTMILRTTALVESFRKPPPNPSASPDLMPAPGALPVVSVMVPLLREDVVLRHLISALKKTTYPKHLLDIKLVIEGDDYATELALAQIDLPSWITVVPVPSDALKTKPRAMNYALEFCRGAVVGIYDAEDRPEPDQLMKIVSHLHFGADDLACVQGYLDFYNARQNWLARCFTIEYATWFRVLLRGAQRLGVPLPLGGTTVFFKRDILEQIGAWDAHNVTEDADLGMRLARFGYRTEMVATTTMEEANCRPTAWVKQRSRWLKGYAVTWATHMRTPVKLYSDLGFAGFWGFQVLFLGALTAYLATPVFWLLWCGAIGIALPVWAEVPPVIWTGFFSTMITGQAIMLCVAYRAVSARPRRHLIPFVLTLGLYWPLGALAAYKAIFEVFYRPFYWDKTAHGL